MHLYSSVDAVLLLLSLPVLAASAYLALLTLLSARLDSPKSPAEPHLRFDVVVPAHDEEAGIAATVESLLRLQYPRSLFRVIVVADNCRDGTAARAAAAGALVWPRADPVHVGKGHALAFAFQRSLADGLADAVIVVDADTLASGNLLQAFASRLEHGDLALQADDGVGNRWSSWRTCLMAIAFALFNKVRSRGRERLEVSCGLRGNGMCLSTRLLREVPYQAFSVVEDIEYGLRLGEAGHRVRYVDEAHVFAEMAAGARASRSQRMRWEAGRFALMRTRAGHTAALALRRRDRVLADLAVDLLIPPLTYLVLAAVAGVTASAVLSATAREAMPSLLAWTLTTVLLTLYIGRGWALSGTGLRGLRDLALAPAYMAWKVLLFLWPHEDATGRWVRAEREADSTPEGPCS